MPTVTFGAAKNGSGRIRPVCAECELQNQANADAKARAKAERAEDKRAAKVTVAPPVEPKPKKAKAEKPRPRLAVEGPYVPPEDAYPLDEGPWRLCDTCGVVKERHTSYLVILTDKIGAATKHSTTCIACKAKTAKEQYEAEQDEDDDWMPGRGGRGWRSLAGGQLSPQHLKRHLRRAALFPPDVCGACKQQVDMTPRAAMVEHVLVCEALAA